MVKYVYLDAVFFVNWLMNSVLLFATSRVANQRESRLRLLVAGALGALYAVAAVVFPNTILDTSSTKLASLAAMVWLAFWPKDIVQGLSALGYFLMVSFAVAGATMALGQIFLHGSTDIGWTLVIGGATIVTFGARALASRMTMRENLPRTVDTSVTVDDRTVRFVSFVDTGNHLKDPLSGWPVIVTESEAIASLMPEDVRKAIAALLDGDDFNIGDLPFTSWARRIRVVPFDSLGKKNGMLLGFRADSVTLKGETTCVTTDKAIIGVYGRRISADGDYEALVGPEMVGKSAD